MNLARLNRLVVVLEEVAADPKKARDFDMGTWATETQSCGTHACACGWGAMDPELQKEGLRLVEYDAARPPRRMKLVYGDDTGFDAAASFFGLTAHRAAYLFDRDEYRHDSNNCEEVDEEEIVIERVKIAAVIARIKQFISDHQEPTT